MKKLIFCGLAIVLTFIACEEKKQEIRYTQQSSEIETFKKIINAYEARNWEEMVSHYADTAKIMHNSVEEDGMNLTELVASEKEDAALFSSWDFGDEDSEYEMVVTDEGKTWVNFWGDFKGVLNANNKTYTIPVHLTAQFVDGIVVKEFGYWDNSKINQDLQALMTAEKTDTTEAANSEM